MAETVPDSVASLAPSPSRPRPVGARALDALRRSPGQLALLLVVAVFLLRPEERGASEPARETPVPPPGVQATPLLPWGEAADRTLSAYGNLVAQLETQAIAATDSSVRTAILEEIDRLMELRRAALGRAAGGLPPPPRPSR